MNVESYRPQAKVTFYTEKGELVARATNKPDTPIDNDVLSVITNRDMQTDSPTFAIELVPRKPWHKWIASNDLLIIEMSRPPEKSARVFIGLVDDCRKKTTVADNLVRRTISVVGRGVAKPFVRFDIGVVPEAEYTSTGIGYLERAGVTVSGSTPAKIAEGVWDTICKKHVNYTWTSGLQLFDYVDKKFSDRPNISLLDESSLTNWHGSIHALMKDIAEEPFYEVFWDMSGGKDVLNVRPTPFNEKEWKSLFVTRIEDDEVIDEEIGRSDVETYAIYSVGAQTLFSSQDTYKTFGVLPYWNEGYAKKYGNTRLHVETSYMSVTEESDISQQQPTMIEFMKDLYNWNIMNNTMLNGTLIVRGSNRFKVGSRVLYRSKDDGVEYEFYVTSVSHNFINYGRYVTTLGVTRGMQAKERFKKPWGTYTEYRGLGIIPFDPVKAREEMEIGGQDGDEGPIGGIDTGSANTVVAGAKNTMNNGIGGVKIRYTFGGNTPSRGLLDCSSWTQYIYKTYAGIDIGRTTGQQVTKGTKLDKSELLPGDLVLFKGTYASNHIYGVSHVGIYIGGGEFIHNSSSKSVTIDKLSNSYYVAHWLMGRRVLTMSQIRGGIPGGGPGPSLDPGPISGGNWKTFQATAYGATALNLGAPSWWVPSGKTATGTRPVEGRTIAVDPKVIPLYSLVQITCSSYPSVNGTYTAEDTGGAIKGNRIDIYFDDLPPKDNRIARQRMLAFGRRDLQVKVIRKGKG